MSVLRPGEVKIERLGKRYCFRSITAGPDESENLDEGGPEEDASLGTVASGWFGARRAEVWALRDISCHIEPGDRVAVIGANGAGKSTLIRILGRSLPPSEGTVTGAGIVVPFGSLRRPLSPQISGCDNLRLLARLLGIPPDHLEERLPQIVEFSGLGPLAYEKVSRYSDQSFARLSVAMAVLISADIYLVDDGVKAGDELFRQKFEERFAERLQAGATLIFASNGLEQLRRYCRRGLWLDRGRLHAEGDVAEIIQRFRATSDDAVDLADWAGAEPELAVTEPTEWVGAAGAEDHAYSAPGGDGPVDGVHPTELSFLADSASLQPMEDWAEQTRRAEKRWASFIARRRGKVQTGLSNSGRIVTGDPCTLGTVQAIGCIDSEGRPSHKFLPGERLGVDVLLRTFESDVRIGVRLEMHKPGTLIFVSEPLLPLLADRPGLYLMRAEVSGDFLARVPENIMHKFVARVLFAKIGDQRREMVSATSRFDVRGDLRVQFDEERRSQGERATSLIEPTPAFVQAASSIEGFSELPPEQPPLTRWQKLARLPALYPKLNWIAFRVIEQATESAAVERPHAGVLQ